MGIYIAAALASVMAMALWGGVALRVSNRAHLPVLVSAFVLMLPMQPLAFYAVRLPLLGNVQAALGTGIATLIVLMLAAPLTEEPAKWIVLTLRSVRRAIQSGSAIGLAIAAGLGFGVGEIWFLADRIAKVPALQATPFYEFWGFMLERAEVCFLHGMFLMPLFYALSRGRSVVIGALIGILMHLVVNLPALAIQMDVFGLGRQFWALASTVWLLVLVAGGLYMVNRLTDGRLVYPRAAVE